MSHCSLGLQVTQKTRLPMYLKRVAEISGRDKDFRWRRSLLPFVHMINSINKNEVIEKTIPLGQEQSHGPSRKLEPGSQAVPCLPKTPLR